MLRQLPVEVSFCGYDRIELDCGGALLDLLPILESFLFISLDACMKAMLLKHGSFSFSSDHSPRFFSGGRSCVVLLP